MNRRVASEIKLIERLGGKVEVNGNDMTISRGCIPVFIVVTLVKRIRKADRESYYTITIKPA